MERPPEANGAGPHATKAEHESLRHLVEREFAEVKEQLKFLADQSRLTGQAMELLLAAQGLDMPGDEDA